MLSSMDGIISSFFVILLMTAFVKIFTVLTILRYGLGITRGGFGIVVLALSFALSLLLSAPQIEALGGLKIFSDSQALSKSTPLFRPFLEKNSDPVFVKQILSLTDEAGSLDEVSNEAKSSGTTSLRGDAALMVAFLLSELKKAFTSGFLILLPFLIIDLIVGSILTTLDFKGIGVHVISLPLKLLLFLAVGGWEILGERLLGGYI